MRSMLLRGILGMTSVLAGMAGGATCAQAAHDLSGPWLLVPQGESVSRLDLVVEAGVVSGGDWQGTLDEGTGEFHLTFVLPFNACDDTITLDGTVAADGRTLTASLHEFWLEPAVGASFEECKAHTIDVTGTRCGNNRLEAWEQCDFGDANDGDCCSSSCQAASAGSDCPSDANDCTHDACDAAGACTHAVVEGSCAEPHGCGSGQCAAGVCVVDAPTAAGASCDLDASVCTPDACNGAGACVAGEAVSCWPCGTCDAVEGCVRGGYFDNFTCQDPGEGVRLTVRTGDRPKRRGLKMSMRNLDLYGFGDDPTADTWHFACLYDDDGSVVRPIFGAVVPPGGDCGGQPCWELHAYDYGFTKRWRFGDVDGAVAGGIVAMTVDDFRGFDLRAGGEGLDIPSRLSTTSTLVPLFGVRQGYDYYSGACWSTPVTAQRRTETMFRGGR